MAPLESLLLHFMIMAFPYIELSAGSAETPRFSENIQKRCIALCSDLSNDYSEIADLRRLDRSELLRKNLRLRATLAKTTLLLQRERKKRSPSLIDSDDSNPYGPVKVTVLPPGYATTTELLPYPPHPSQVPGQALVAAIFDAVNETNPFLTFAPPVNPYQAAAVLPQTANQTASTSRPKATSTLTRSSLTRSTTASLLTVIAGQTTAGILANATAQSVEGPSPALQGAGTTSGFSYRSTATTVSKPAHLSANVTAAPLPGATNTVFAFEFGTTLALRVTSESPAVISPPPVEAGTAATKAPQVVEAANATAPYPTIPECDFPGADPEMGPGLTRICTPPSVVPLAEGIRDNSAAQSVPGGIQGIPFPTETRKAIKKSFSNNIQDSDRKPCPSHCACQCEAS